MDAFRRRIAVAVLAVAGLATLALSAQSVPLTVPLLLHRQIMTAMLGGALLLSIVLPVLRLPTVGAAVLTKVTLVGVLLAVPGSESLQAMAEAVLALMLAAAGAVFVHEKRQEARWDSGLPLEG